jgi:RND family efflux transporter MFP subunit
LFLGFCLGLSGCSHASEAGPEKQPPKVTVSYPIEREVTDYQDYTGRTAAVDSVQVQARVSGYLERIYFKEGAEVAEGAVLYEIDPRPYRDAYDYAKAQVAANEAQAKKAKLDNARNKKVALTPGAVSQQDLDLYQAAEDQAVANLESSRSKMETAKLNLDWSKVTAPVNGLVGRLLVTRGNLILANQTTLTTVICQDPMWVYFDMDEPTALRVRELARQGKFGPVKDGPPKIPFHLRLSGEKGFPHEAMLDFVNNQIDQATATLLIRAVFPNPLPANGGPRLFTPNNFVVVRVPTSPPYQAVLVSPEAVGTDQDLKYLYVVDQDNKAVRHAVKLGSIHDGLQAITEGLKPGERVIVNGLQRVQQGATVNANLVPMPMPREGSASASSPSVVKALSPTPKK